MHAKPDLRVVLKWMIAGSGSVIADVIPLTSLRLRMNTLRWLVIAILLFISLMFAGSAIWSFGENGWILWIVLVFLSPIFLSALAPKFEILIGCFANLSIELSLAIARYNWAAGQDRPIENADGFIGSSPFLIAGALLSIIMGTRLGYTIGKERRKKQNLRQANAG